MDWIPQASLLYGTAFSLASIALTSGRYLLDWLYMLFWAWLIAMLTAVGIATMFIGLAIMVPRVGHATWRAYRVVFRRLLRGVDFKSLPNWQGYSMDRAVAERRLIYEPYSRAAPVVQPKQMPPIGFD